MAKADWNVAKIAEHFGVSESLCRWRIIQCEKGGGAVFERQSVYDNGQIKGGLTSFMEGELEKADLVDLYSGF